MGAVYKRSCGHGSGRADISAGTQRRPFTITSSVPLHFWPASGLASNAPPETSPRSRSPWIPDSITASGAFASVCRRHGRVAAVHLWSSLQTGELGWHHDIEQTYRFCCLEKLCIFISFLPGPFISASPRIYYLAFSTVSLLFHLSGLLRQEGISIHYLAVGGSTNH